MGRSSMTNDSLPEGLESEPYELKSDDIVVSHPFTLPCLLAHPNTKYRNSESTSSEKTTRRLSTGTKSPPASYGSSTNKMPTSPLTPSSTRTLTNTSTPPTLGRAYPLFFLRRRARSTDKLRCRLVLLNPGQRQCRPQCRRRVSGGWAGWAA
jgi:hypothetical protein